MLLTPPSPSLSFSLSNPPSPPTLLHPPPPSHHSLLSPSHFSLLYYSTSCPMKAWYTTIHQVGGAETYDKCEYLLFVMVHRGGTDGMSHGQCLFIVCSCVKPTYHLKPAFASTLKTIYQSGSYYSPNIQCIPPDTYLLRLEFSTWWRVAVLGFFNALEFFPWTYSKNHSSISQ